MCTENNKLRTTNSFELLHGNFSWKCTRRSLQIDLSCKASQQKNATRMCCEVSIQNKNNTLTRRPASCKGIVRTKKFNTDHNPEVRIFNCEWEWSSLNISLHINVSRKHGIYYPCTAPHNNTYLQTCHMTLSTTATTLTTAKRTTGSSAINETLTSVGKTLTKSVHGETSRNCSATLIQELLMKIEETVRLFLSRILNTPATVLPSFVDRFIELHGIITTNANDSLMVPDPLEEKESQGTFSLQRGSIDIGRGRLGIVTVVFKFSALCNDTRDLGLDSADTNRSSLLQSPIVSVLAMTQNGSVGALQRNATLRFKIKRTEGSSIRCMFLNHTSTSNKSFWSDNGMTFVDNSEDNFTTCLTDHLTSFAVLIDYNNDDEKIQLSDTEKQVLDLITKTGSGFAIFCLLACVFTFARVRGLSDMRYRIHLNLCAALAAAQLVFVTGIDATKIKGVCVAVAVMLHYFFTASFTWMFVEAVHLFLKIVSVFNIRITRMRYYVAIGWGIPVLIVAISVSVYHEGYGTSKLCWLSLDGGFIWAFLIPVVIIVSINVFVLVAIIVVRVSLKGNPLSPGENKRFAAALKTVIVLFPLLGLCWFFGIVGVMTNSRPFIYAFVVLSSLQGFFILVFHCIGNTEVRGSLKALKDRHSLESSIRQEQKKRLRESRTEQKISSSMRANPAGKKNLIKQVSGLKQSRKKREKATNV
ncbi:adhesion G protein-coupled receptor L3-like isoform X2 [Orbicella faveolata]|uniref:adhesion G protein-coupled receptor L3-like isoform X2 n=1 Tax=Orbicella faveolata TaxID=48498 RepID=UPI0009E240A8|nr:adhesion G protein-coupled receptor L3-like isoform X2 [Orbicella faveolata]